MTSLIREQDVTILHLEASYASLDEGALEKLGEVLLSEAAYAEPPRLVLDLSRTQFIGSRFIELLVRAWKRVRTRGGSMALCGVQPLCAEVLRVARLDTLWTSYATRSEAVGALAGSVSSGTPREPDQADGRR